MTVKYSKVERRIHRDQKLRRFPREEPNPITLWKYLLSNEAQTAFPGLYVLRLLVVADDMRWSVDEVRATLEPLVAEGMARFDETTGVVWLPNAVRKHSAGLTPNAVKAWRNAWHETPDCDISRAAFLAAIETLREVEVADGKAPGVFVELFLVKAPKWMTADALRLASECPSDAIGPPSDPHRSPIRSQDQDQDQDKHQHQDKDKDHAAPPAPPTPDPGDPALTETEAAVLAELEVFADLWPTEKPRARMYTAIRVARAVAVEPACARDGLDAPAVVRLALPKVRTWASGLTHTSDRQRLAKVDEAVAWILGDVRKGRYRQAPNAAEKSRPSGGELDEIKQRQRRQDREEREKAEEAKRRAPRPSPAAIADLVANLGKPAPAKGAA